MKIKSVMEVRGEKGGRERESQGKKVVGRGGLEDWWGRKRHGEL